MNDQPLVSICIPTYNGADYIRHCIDSCIAQSYQNIEIIVCDDCSVDNTVNILNEYVSKNNKVKCFTNIKNVGLVNNWNRCIELSKGAWIKFVFQDDYIDPNCIELFVKNITPETPLIVSKRSYVLPKDISKENSRYYLETIRDIDKLNVEIRNGFISAEAINIAVVNNLCLNFIGEPSLTFFKKEIINTVGIFDENYAQLCDLDFFLKIACSYGLIYIPQQICHFRIHDKSATNKNILEKHFITSNIDPIILVRNLLYDPHFKTFQSTIKKSDRVKLRSFLAIRTYQAQKEARFSRENHTLLTVTADRYPEIKDLLNPGFATKISYCIILLRRMFRQVF
jgi:glycosyltransferase involved in cell wall biosynthesis